MESFSKYNDYCSKKAKEAPLKVNDYCFVPQPKADTPGTKISFTKFRSVGPNKVQKT